ncbi:MAG: Uncharacterized protein SCO4203, partial [uncultured Blastococcus sp.]
ERGREGAQAPGLAGTVGRPGAQGTPPRGRPRTGAGPADAGDDERQPPAPGRPMGPRHAAPPAARFRPAAGRRPRLRGIGGHHPRTRAAAEPGGRAPGGRRPGDRPGPGGRRGRRPRSPAGGLPGRWVRARRSAARAGAGVQRAPAVRRGVGRARVGHHARVPRARRTDRRGHLRRVGAPLGVGGPRRRRTAHVDALDPRLRHLDAVGSRRTPAEGADPPQRPGPTRARVPACIRRGVGRRRRAVDVRPAAALGRRRGGARGTGLADGGVVTAVAARRGHGAMVGGRTDL